MSKGAMRWFLNVYTEDARGTEYWTISPKKIQNNQNKILKGKLE
jgi:hypothetical protein